MLDVRVRGEGPAATRMRSKDPIPAVLLVSRAGDSEFDVVGRRLEAGGIPVSRLDADTAISAGLIADPRRRLVQIDGQWISPTITWQRHFSSRALPTARSGLRRAFAADSWRALTDQLDVVSAGTIMSRDPGLLVQLATASRSGVAVPPTVVTADPAKAAALVPGAKLVVKALHSHFVEARPGMLHGIFPEIVDRAEIGRVPAGPPVVLQQHIDHEAEVRVYHVQDQVAAAFAITKSGPAAPWLDPEQVTAKRIDPPAAVADATAAIATALSIDFGAFDFLIAGGVPVFLEVNLAGDWRWLEAITREAPVTAAVTAMLRSKHEQVTGAATTLPIGFDLVTFLSRPDPFTTIDKDESSL